MKAGFVCAFLGDSDLRKSINGMEHLNAYMIEADSVNKAVRELTNELLDCGEIMNSNDYELVEIVSDDFNGIEYELLVHDGLSRNLLFKLEKVFIDENE